MPSSDVDWSWVNEVVGQDAPWGEAEVLEVEVSWLWVHEVVSQDAPWGDLEVLELQRVGLEVLEVLELWHDLVLLRSVNSWHVSDNVIWGDLTVSEWIEVDVVVVLHVVKGVSVHHG